MMLAASPRCIRIPNTQSHIRPPNARLPLPLYPLVQSTILPSPTPRLTFLGYTRHINTFVQHIMDPASAIIGIVSFGFVVFAKVNELRKAIKDAPDRVRALQDSCVVINLFLSKLEASGGHSALSCSPEGTRYLQALCEKANVCLTDVDAAVKKVVSGGEIDGRTPKLRLRRRKWIINKGKLDDLEQKMTELRKALCEMLDFLRT